MTQSVHPIILSGLGETAPAGGEATDPRLPQFQLDPRTYDRSLDCVHCGLCLPACPTYTQNGLEADSPRGRIQLMKGLADGKIQPTSQVVKHLDLCLDCRACETACPSGVVYHELIEEARPKLEPIRPTSWIDRITGVMFYHVFPYPLRLKLAMLGPRLLQKARLWPLLTHPKLMRLLPAKLAKMQQMLPPTGPVWETSLDTHYPGNPVNQVDGKPRATVGLFAGCIGSVLFQKINRQTIDILTHLGCDVVVVNGQTCCGAIHHHGGHEHKAADMARQNIDAFTPADGSLKLDCIVNNIAGCGAMLKDYALLLRDDPNYADRAKAFVEKTMDISELLVKLDPPKPTQTLDRTVTYHDACHLAHAQKVVEPPRHVLGWIKGLKVIALPESDMCCGAAGTYNLSQPVMARDLAERKINHIQDTGARSCVTGNVGCAMQIQSEADRLHAGITVSHPVTLLHEAYFGGGE